MNEFIGKLLERFFKERGVVVRVKIVALIGDLARTPGFDPSEVVDDLTAMIKPKGTKWVFSVIHSYRMLVRNTYYGVICSIYFACFLLTY